MLDEMQFCDYIVNYQMRGQRLNMRAKQMDYRFFQTMASQAINLTVEELLTPIYEVTKSKNTIMVKHKDGVVLGAYFFATKSFVIYIETLDLIFEAPPSIYEEHKIPMLEAIEDYLNS